MAPNHMLGFYIMATRSVALVVGGLLCALWLYRLWKRSGDSAYVWMLWGFFLLPNLIPFILGMLFLLALPQSNPFAALSPAMKAAITVLENLLQVAKYCCIFIALSKLSNRAVPFAEIAAPVIKPVLKFIEPLRVKMP